ncbi:MAG: GNAT family N-acetyltransferase [Bacteroidetes bacterium]|nr:GNAT family N-acetyltransferase [Bacteroidota bacterium]
METKIIGIRENPEYLEKGVDYFSTKWNIDRRIYADCISNSISTENPLPRWYLMLKESKIIGSYGIITNDFISRQDLYPWLCALYVEETERKKGLGAMLLEHGRKQAATLGYKKLYLSTDHIGYYEKYLWKYIGIGYHPWGSKSRIYECELIFQ